MRRWLYIILVLSQVLIYSCDSDIVPSPQAEKTLLSSIILSRKDSLTGSIVKVAQYDVLDNEKELRIIALNEESLNFTPSFLGNYSMIKINSIPFQEGSNVDFNEAVTVDIFNENNDSTSYHLNVRGYNGIPIMHIDTKEKQPIVSKEEYVDASCRIINASGLGGLVSECKIKGRGNHSWNASPKKQYKIKLNEKKSIFGFASNKDWVLLGDYDDKTLMRTAYMSEVSKAIGLDYTIDYQHVELYLNDDYLATYTLTSHVEKAKERINIEDDGFIIENDNYYFNELLFFTTDSLGLHYTFKYPDADKDIIKKGDDSYLFIQDFMNKTESALLNIESDGVFFE